MARSRVRPGPPYAGSVAILCTRHAKSLAIGPPLFRRLGMSVLEYVHDNRVSDSEELHADPLQAARRKCEIAMARLGPRASCILASAGRCRPNPAEPSRYCHEEVLYFVDRGREFDLPLVSSTGKTPCPKAVVDSLDAVFAFAARVRFPSHALIVQPIQPTGPTPHFRNIQSYRELAKAFRDAVVLSRCGSVLVEAEWQVCLNPSRRRILEALASRLATQLASLCPRCGTPGWGLSNINTSAAIAGTLSTSDTPWSQQFGCRRCHFTQAPPSGLLPANAANISAVNCR